MIIYLIGLVDLVMQILIIIVIVDVVISYFISPLHPFRNALDSIVNPMLKPIRRAVPLVGMIDFSPIILVVAIQVIGVILKKILILFL